MITVLLDCLHIRRYDGNDESKIRQETYSCVDVVSVVDMPEAAVLDRLVGSFNLYPAVGRLVKD